jgi:hypothetical protein
MKNRGWGLLGIAPNVTALVSGIVGLLRRPALVHGFTEIEDNLEDKLPLLVGFAAALGARVVVNQASQRLLLQVISRALAAQMTREAALRALPLVSSVTGGVLNYALLRTAGRRSAAHWRERHEIIRGVARADLASPMRCGVRRVSLAMCSVRVLTTGWPALVMIGNLGSTSP